MTMSQALFLRGKPLILTSNLKNIEKDVVFPVDELS